jgi:hypothetical protein
MEPRALLAALVTILFWASAFAAIRAGLKGLSPGHLVLLRFLVAGSLLLLYARARGLRPPRREDLPRLFLLGFLGITVYPFYAESLVLGHQWKRVCRLRVSGAFSRTRHRSATTSIISSRS